DPDQRRSGVLEQRELRAAALRVCQHALDAATVLALQAVVQVEPLLHLLQPPGLTLERRLVAAKLDAQVLRLDPQRPQTRRQSIQFGIRALDSLGEALGVRQQNSHSRLAADGLRAAAGRRAQSLERAQPLPVGLQLRLLGHARPQLVDLLELV